METDPQDEKLENLFAAARKSGPRVSGKESGFETRVMARIYAGKGRQLPIYFWSWRLLPFFAAVVVLTAIWMTASEAGAPADLGPMAELGNDESILVAFFTGD